MKTHTFTAAVSTVCLGLGLFLSGCQSESGGDKMSGSDAKMSDGMMSSDKMADEKMSGDKM